MNLGDIPVVGDGFWADVNAGEHRLRLFSEVYELGHVAVVYDVNEHREIARQDADDLNDGKQKAEQAARDYLKHFDITQLSGVNWITNGQARNR
jgi:hypothetical protein